MAQPLWIQMSTAAYQWVSGVRLYRPRIPLAFTMPNALRAAGDVRVPMAVSIVSMVTVRVGGSYLLGLHFGLGAIGVWIAMVGDWIVRVICFVLRARKKLWLEHP